MLLIATAVGCGAAAKGAAPPTGLLDQIKGPRTQAGALIINERTGRIGALRLGMSFAAMRKMLPARYYWGAMVPGTDASYCSRPRGNTCSGIALDLTSGCTTPPTVPCFPNGHGPVYEIDLSAAMNPANAPEAAGAVTLRGIRLGTPVRKLLGAYVFTEVGGTTCAGETPAPAKNYITVNGQTTTAFTVYEHAVWSIALIWGRFPHYCANR